MSKVALITSNPEKSKHLETATLRIDNFWVDFVNLRTESYVQDSRIPSINIGTPMEDAFRRCVLCPRWSVDGGVANWVVFFFRRRKILAYFERMRNCTLHGCIRPARLIQV